MTDREMLELCAKAMGFKDYSMHGNMVFIETGDVRGESGYYWNPLTDDGDCARMEAALGIHVYWADTYVSCSHFHKRIRKLMEQCNDFHNHVGDRNAARRMASCLVAMMIGRDTP